MDSLESIAPPRNYLQKLVANKLSVHVLNRGNHRFIVICTFRANAPLVVKRRLSNYWIYSGIFPHFKICCEEVRTRTCRNGEGASWLGAAKAYVSVIFMLITSLYIYTYIIYILIFLLITSLDWSKKRGDMRTPFDPCLVDKWNVWGAWRTIKCSLRGCIATSVCMHSSRPGDSLAGQFVWHEMTNCLL